ncbi:MAG: DUF924 family protein [Pseudomonadota bacterium]
MSDPRIDAVLAFWFERLSMEEWFTRSDRVDQLIQEHLAALMGFAAQGTLHHWRDTLRGTRALILLLDQVPRNCFREDPRAFAHDHQAASITDFALKHYGEEIAALSPTETLFVLLPFEHAEDLSLQNRCVQLFKAFADRFTDADSTLWNDLTDYAIRHQVVIEQFGRFPHRNQVLGRDTTADEAAWLADNPTGF